MNRMFSIFKRDLISSFREFLLIYIILIPIILAIALRFFIPSINSVSFKFAIDKNMDNKIIEQFKDYGSIELFDGREEIKGRVKKVDDVIGIMQKDKDNFIVIMEGNEKESSKFIPQQIIRSINKKSNESIVKISNIETKISLVAVYGASSIILMAIVFSGVIVGFNIIEEKELGTIGALNTTPMTSIDFILGKSIIGFILPIIESFIILWILNMMSLNIGMMIVITLTSSLISILFGFLIGVFSSNQIAGVANMKLLLILVSASYVGAILLPKSKQGFLYWSHYIGVV